MASTTRRRISSPSGKDKTLPPIRPNAGIEANYSRRLQALVDDMHKSLVYWLSASWPDETPEMAADLSRASHMRIAVKKLARRWLKNFDNAAKPLADYFATAAAERSDAVLKKALKDAGLTVELKLTRSANNVIQATIHENVSLIKSIAQRHLQDVETLVARSVSQGRDLGWLTAELADRYEITKRRAAFIAQSQNNMATAALNKIRLAECGITEAVWIHSGGGRHPRPSHVSYSGKKFNVAEGALIDGQRIQPGQLPRCRCCSRPILPGLRAE